MKLLIILLVLCSPLIFLSILGSRYKNPYRLFLIFGKKGSGKSTALVKLAIKYHKKGYLVYTNMSDMCLPYVRLINVDDLGEFVPEENSLLLLDEVGMIWDNRNFKSFKPSVRDFFKLQRHYKVICYLASQTFDVDKKIRDLTDGMYLAVNLFNCVSVLKRITRKVVLTESVGDSESRISENLKFTLPFDWIFTYIPTYHKYYNSFVVPDMPKLQYTSIVNQED